MTEALLEVNNVSKFFGSVIALQDVSATVQEGEVTCILGDNGAGKSTLIKILSGVYPADKGDYVVQGQKVKFSSPRDALDHLANGWVEAVIMDRWYLEPVTGASRRR